MNTVLASTGLPQSTADMVPIKETGQIRSDNGFQHLTILPCCTVGVVECLQHQLAICWSLMRSVE